MTKDTNLLICRLSEWCGNRQDVILGLGQLLWEHQILQTTEDLFAQAKTPKDQKTMLLYERCEHDLEEIRLQEKEL
ncbi:hypothetical protein RCL_jg13524.t1 [Rhizophagus clarus]|uniref:Uncharacterized protein n=1 Tax=Rhizophagus clarus TaxID=94130 RepID=A0A8H3QSP5_9GLOM|nr:hypothetical protein RCL_jg13524.t1 [Rhizophagus clarus]